MIQIDKGVPVPENVKVAGKRKYPWDEMDIGDSFYVEGFRRDNFAKYCCSLVSKISSPHHGKKFIVRREGKGLRVWRVK